MILKCFNINDANTKISGKPKYNDNKIISLVLWFTYFNYTKLAGDKSAALFSSG